ncbi:NAD(P)-dependent alcohol dehydrogenase [Alcaligenes faecalis]|uniref:zinc-dependent alcohol dehydrogenase family protein n=1 Tax=Alcaligenes faecalis TaxID=511 RepID=UPI0010CA3ED4|nr:NAD(P)-dependent alcohol dehydrogenase [Alcaligenes faecalis]QCP81059.1 NAD(P)-dependent alcohol dehydrogenase [Alcaligenes faecalis]
MDTYRFTQYGSLDYLVRGQEPLPEPGPGQVRVQVMASSLNFRDLLVMKGTLRYPTTPGAVPLSDAAGIIDALGPGVQRFKLGDRVINSFFPNWFGGPAYAGREQYGVEHDGWLTQYKVVSAEALSPMPAHLSFEEAATLPCAALTAWSALAGINAGDTVLTQGAGGVSIFAIQLAKAMGAYVISSTSSDNKFDKLLQLGADQVFNYKDTPEWSELVRDYTHGEGANRIVDVGGPVTIAQSIKAIAVGGQVSLIGSLGKSVPSLDVMDLVFSQASYKAIGVGSRSDLETMNRVISQHRIHPVIDRVFDFNNAHEAYRYLQQRDRFGKIVIHH